MGGASAVCSGSGSARQKARVVHDAGVECRRGGLVWLIEQLVLVHMSWCVRRCVVHGVVWRRHCGILA